ncbi:hypothetical protein [Candidatus Poriferisodalis sp.]|uniref:hypothetical protein n=1 Tax=Candidatus Poriferisodalis sp. TaxID=3101277 RepID=UPI003B01B237
MIDDPLANALRTLGYEPPISADGPEVAAIRLLPDSPQKRAVLEAVADYTTSRAGTPFEVGLSISEALARTDAVQAEFDARWKCAVGNVICEYQLLRRRMAILCHIADSGMTDDRVVEYVDKFCDDHTSQFRREALRQLEESCPEASEVLAEFDRAYETRNLAAHTRFEDGMVYFDGMPEPGYWVGKQANKKWMTVTQLNSLADKMRELEVEKLGPILRRRSDATEEQR